MGSMVRDMSNFWKNMEYVRDEKDTPRACQVRHRPVYHATVKPETTTLSVEDIENHTLRSFKAAPTNTVKTPAYAATDANTA
jgi:hypothetical protein